MERLKEKKWPWQANLVIYVACCILIPGIAGYVTLDMTGSMGDANNAVLAFVGIIVLATIVLWFAWQDERD